MTKGRLGVIRIISEEKKKKRGEKKRKRTGPMHNVRRERRGGRISRRLKVHLLDQFSLARSRRAVLRGKGGKKEMEIGSAVTIARRIG